MRDVYQSDIEIYHGAIVTVAYHADSMGEAKRVVWTFGIPVCDPVKLEAYYHE